MSSIRIGLKGKKVGVFLVALRDPRIVRCLARYGFREEHLEEGWRLFDTVAEERLAKGKRSNKPTLLDQISAFESHWYPLVKVILARHYPVVSESLFEGLERSEGKEASYSVTQFVKRLGAMTAGEGDYGEAGPAARALLIDRGLTEEVVGEARELLIRLKAFDRTTSADNFVTPEVRKANEDAMWAWYLEWSGIARRVVKDGNLLRHMGFKKPRGGSTVAEEVIDETEEVEAAEAAPAAGGTAATGGTVAAETTVAAEATETANDVDAAGATAATASSEEGDERAA